MPAQATVAAESLPHLGRIRAVSVEIAVLKFDQGPVWAEFGEGTLLADPPVGAL